MIGILLPLLASWSPLPVQGQLLQVQPPPTAEAPPPGSPGPGRRDCEEIASRLVPLVPYYLDQVPEELRYQRYSLTSQTDSTIWFYIPYETDLIKSVRIDLWHWESDTARTLVYAAQMQNPQNGLIAVDLDNSTHDIEPESWYQVTLYVDAYCDDQSPVVESETTAWIQQSTSSDVTAGLPFPEQVAAYLTHDFWYDAAHLQVQRYCQDNEIESLTRFLASGNLSEAVVLDDAPQCTIANFQSE